MQQTEGSRPPRGGLVSVVATVVGNAYLFVGSVFFGALAIATVWVPPAGSWVTRCARWWSQGVLWSSGVKVTSHSATSLESDRPYVFMANHQSLIDIPALLTTLPGHTRMLAKKSLFRIPVFGWALGAGGFIAIDRDDRSKARESFAQAVEKLSSGVSTLIFPEGTRSLDGAIAPLQRGGFLLALKSGLPIVPVGVRGSLEVRRKDSLTVHPGSVEVHYGTPIEVSEFGVRQKRELVERVRLAIAELAAAPLAGTGARPPSDSPGTLG